MMSLSSSFSLDIAFLTVSIKICVSIIFLHPHLHQQGYLQNSNRDLETKKSQPHVKRGVFLKRAQPFFLATCTTRKMVCHLRFTSISFSFFQVSNFGKLQLISKFILIKLMFYILRNSEVIFSYCINIISSAPERPVSIFIFQFSELLINHRTTFSFEISHER